MPFSDPRSAGIIPDSWNHDKSANMIPKEDNNNQILLRIYLSHDGFNLIHSAGNCGT